jgi:preprotein translocase subunit SecY
MKKKKLPDLDKYIIFSFVVMILYTIAEFIVSSITGISHDTLTTCLYGAFGGELLMCAMIKRLKLKRSEGL